MYKRALVPLDGSPVADAIVPFIVQIAGPLDMTVRLLAVVEPIQPTMIENAGSVMAQDLAARTRYAEDYLSPIAAELRGRGVDADWEVRHGRPATAILAAAKSFRADLIAMSTHGRSGLGRVRHRHLPAVLGPAEVYGAVGGYRCARNSDHAVAP